MCRVAQDIERGRAQRQSGLFLKKKDLEERIFGGNWEGWRGKVRKQVGAHEMPAKILT